MTAAAFPSSAGHGLHPSSRSLLGRAKEGRPFPPLPSTARLPADRRGRLRNGARPGDFLAAPRCGARTRCGGACRQPAMANGRCRLHGGLSTGPRTAEGRARCARARLIHGGYAADTRALMAEARTHLRRVHGLLALGATAGHGVLRSESANRTRRTPKNRAGGLPMSFASSRLRGEPSPLRRRSIPAGHGVPRSISPATAGHGVLRPESSSRPSARAARLLAGAAPLAPFSAGHGVLSPIQKLGGVQADTTSHSLSPMLRNRCGSRLSK